MDYNGYIASKVMLPVDGHTFAAGVVKQRSRDQEGELIGKTNSNPLLDSSMREVQFEDGSVDRHHANIVAENIHSRIDSEGHSQCMLDETLDCKLDDTATRNSKSC